MRYDHERLPGYISNSLELTMDVLGRSEEYDIHGNIDLDQGYSFLYQIAIFFPMQFQKQVIKTTFEPYDYSATNDEYSKNLQRVGDFQGKAGEKVPLENMMRGVKPENENEGEGEDEKTKVPTMTPLDSVSNLKSNIEYKNVVSPQLKRTDWLHLVGEIIPQTKDYMKRQIAMLNNDNPIDLLLKFGYDLTCEVQDISVMNALVEDISKKHQLCVDGSLKQFLKAKEFEEIKYKDTTELYSQFMEALEDNLKFNFPDAFNVIKASKRLNKKSENYFFNLPEHLIHAYYMLRHLKIRDYKTKILYTLNYYRSIQKRLTLDLHEISTRDRVGSDQELRPPNDATRLSKKNLSNDTSAGAVGASKKQQLAKARAALANQTETKDKSESADYNYVQSIYQKAKELNTDLVTDERFDESKNPIDRNKYRFKEKLHNKFISTCPIMSRYHTSFGYTTHRMSVAEEMEYDQEYKDNMDVQAKKFMGRNDFVEFTDAEEILVKDDFGIYIMYDCVETDMELLRDEILLTGSYFIKRQEPLTDAENTERLNSVIDRISTLEMLMKYEAKFQYKKAQLLRLYMETYEHMTDADRESGEMIKFIQLITNIMAERPRLNLDSNSFEDSYKIELQILDKRLDLLRNIIRFQVSHEKRINENICDYLEKAHKLINDNLNNKWKHLRPQDVNEELDKRGLQRESVGLKFDHSNNSHSSHKTEKKNQTKESMKIKGTDKKEYNRQESPSKQEMQEVFKGKRKGLIGLEEEPEDRFSQALGLPKISQEDIYKKYRENDQEALDIMNEHASFIKNEEGFPQRFNCNEYCLDTTMTGEKIGVFDFYESLG